MSDRVSNFERCWLRYDKRTSLVHEKVQHTVDTISTLRSAPSVYEIVYVCLAQRYIYVASTKDLVNIERTTNIRR